MTNPDDLTAMGSDDMLSFEPPKRWQVYRRDKEITGAWPDRSWFWSEWYETIKLNIEPTEYLKARNDAHADRQWKAELIYEEPDEIQIPIVDSIPPGIDD